MKINKYFIENYDVILELDFNEDVDFDDRSIESFNSKGKSNESRKCRFCNCVESKENPFSDISHVIPEGLGNKNIITQNECNRCNHKFGDTIEKSLGNYFSVLKPLFRIPTKKKNISFEHNKINQKNKILFDKNDKKLKIETTMYDSIKLDVEKKELEFKLPRYEYIPFEVYQAFIRIFISLLPKQYVHECDFAKIILYFNEVDKFSSDESNKNLLKNIILKQAKAIVCFIPYLPKSDLIILRKNKENFTAPDFIFVIRIQNKAFQFCLQKLENNAQNIQVPSFFNEFIDEFNQYKEIYDIPGTVRQWIEDFSITEKVNNKEEIITFGFQDIKETKL